MVNTKHRILFNEQSHSLIRFGVKPSSLIAYVEFFTTFAISSISAALGLAKCLKNGVAKPIAAGGSLDGLLSGKFSLGFLASGLGLVFKGFCIGFIVVSRHYQHSKNFENLYS